MCIVRHILQLPMAILIRMFSLAFRGPAGAEFAVMHVKSGRKVATALGTLGVNRCGGSRSVVDSAKSSYGRLGAVIAVVTCGDKPKSVIEHHSTDR